MTETVEAATKIVAELEDRLESLTGRAGILHKQRAAFTIPASLLLRAAETIE
jgi:hypothetical protein